MKSTKKALISAIIAVVICCTMFVGSTFAWFTDQAESKGNKIVAGTFEMDLRVDTNENGQYEEPESIKNSSAPLFTEEADGQWEPGKTAVRYLAIVNTGSLDMKYTVSIDVKETDGLDMYKVMKYDIIPNAEYGEAEEWLDEGLNVSLGYNVVGEATNVVIEGETMHKFALAIHMDEEAGIEYAGGVVEFDIKVVAGQVDKLAPMGNGGAALLPADTITTETAVSEGETATASNADGTFKAEAIVGSTGVLNGSIVPTNGTESTFTANAGNGKSITAYDIKVTGQKENEVVKVEFFLGKNLVDVVMYHDGDEMEKATSGEHGTYSYNATTGYVTIYTREFSPFEATYYYANNVPLARVTTLEPQKISATIGMGGAAQEMNLDVGYIFAMTQTPEEAAASPYAKYHADFVITVDKDIQPGAAALVGWYDLYCVDYNDNNWVAIMDDTASVPANTEIRLIELLLNGGSINYEELGNFVKEFKCGASMLDDSVIGTTLTVELRLYEVTDKADSNTNSWNEETGEYLTVCTYRYTF